VRAVAVDAAMRMDVADLRRRIEADRAADADPLCVVATAGTVVTGAVDPIAEAAAVTDQPDPGISRWLKSFGRRGGRSRRRNSRGW
jgi:glutamate/tyrosine decarboxylase-like PLP-dependent enzyme